VDVVEWVRKALADPNLTPLRKLLRRRDLPPEVRSSVEAYIEAEEKLRANPNWISEIKPAPPPRPEPAPRGPIIHASFLDFAEGKDPPIRYERGDPFGDGRKPRAVDRETGEYARFHMPHWQDPTREYFLFSPDDTKFCNVVVQQVAIDVSGDRTVGLHKVRVIRITQLSEDGSWSDVDDGYSPIAQRLTSFITAYLVDNPYHQAAEITFDLGGEVRSRYS